METSILAFFGVCLIKAQQMEPVASGSLQAGRTLGFSQGGGLCNDSTALASLTPPLASEAPPTALFRGFPFSGRTK